MNDATTSAESDAKRTPRLEIYPGRIASNARSVIELCGKHGVRVACVTKVTSAHPSVAAAFVESGADMLADSRVSNLRFLKSLGYRLPLLMLRLPALSEVNEVVEVADISLNSSPVTMQALSDVAVSRKLKHKVVVMIDVGDLREGIRPDRAVATLQKAKEMPGIEVIGLGCNLACFGGVIPSVENMRMLIDTRDACRRETGLELSVLSGGNSSGLPLMASGDLPKEINHFRIGEAIILGRNVIDRSPWPGTRQDAIIAVGEVVEAEIKPSVPIGARGQDAFGGVRPFPERGNRRRAICNLGRQDVLIDGITPLDKGIEVLGGSSDHLILDVEDASSPVNVGDEIRFYPDYGALLALSTSKYVSKVVIKEA